MNTVKSGGTWTTVEAAEFLGISEATLRGWRHKGYGPKSFTLGQRAVRYLEQDVRDWLDEQIKASA